jgi:hypothetical protein
VSLTRNPVGEPDAANPHVRFDERGRETGRCCLSLPRSSSTLPEFTVSPFAPLRAIRRGANRLRMTRYVDLFALLCLGNNVRSCCHDACLTDRGREPRSIPQSVWLIQLCSFIFDVHDVQSPGERAAKIRLGWAMFELPTWRRRDAEAVGLTSRGCEPRSILQSVWLIQLCSFFDVHDVQSPGERAARIRLGWAMFELPALRRRDAEAVGLTSRGCEPRSILQSVWLIQLCSLIFSLRLQCSTRRFGRPQRS